MYYEQIFKCEGLKTELSILENSTKDWNSRNMEIPIDVNAYSALSPFLNMPYYDKTISLEEQLVKDQSSYYEDYLRQKKSNDIIA